MTKFAIAIITICIFAGIAFASYESLRQKERWLENWQPAQEIWVVIAARDIPKNSTIKSTDLERVIMDPARFSESHYRFYRPYQWPEHVSGYKVTERAIKKGEVFVITEAYKYKYTPGHFGTFMPSPPELK